MVWYGMVWYGMVWYGMVWYGMEVVAHACKRALNTNTYGVCGILTQHTPLNIPMQADSLTKDAGAASQTHRACVLDLV